MCVCVCVCVCVRVRVCVCGGGGGGGGGVGDSGVCHLVSTFGVTSKTDFFWNYPKSLVFLGVLLVMLKEYFYSFFHTVIRNCFNNAISVNQSVRFFYVAGQLSHKGATPEKKNLD